MFEVTQFESGEKDVKIVGRLKEFVVHWNWFEDKDIMTPLLKADAIKRNYGNVEIALVINYFPYSRQDRMFEAGQPVPWNVIWDILKENFDHIETMAIHSGSSCEGFENKIIDINVEFFKDKTVVYPDKSAEKHFSRYEHNWGVCAKSITLEKQRTELGIESKIIEDNSVDCKNFVICDDICSGGRTFIECAKILKEKYPDCHIDLLVYHAFLDRGTKALLDAGIENIYIINPDSYRFVLEKHHKFVGADYTYDKVFLFESPSFVLDK